MQILLTLRTYLVDKLQNPQVKILIWQDTNVYENTDFRNISASKVFEVYVVYKQEPTGLGYDIRFLEQK